MAERMRVIIMETEMRMMRIITTNIHIYSSSCTKYDSKDSDTAYSATDQPKMAPRLSKVRLWGRPIKRVNQNIRRITQMIATDNTEGFYMQKTRAQTISRHRTRKRGMYHLLVSYYPPTSKTTDLLEGTLIAREKAHYNPTTIAAMNKMTGTMMLFIEGETIESSKMGILLLLRQADNHRIMMKPAVKGNNKHLQMKRQSLKS